MKKFLIASLVVLIGCQPPEYLNVEKTSSYPVVSFDSLNLSTIDFKEPKTINYTYPAQGNPKFYITIKGAVPNTAITFNTPCLNMTGFEVKCIDAFFKKKSYYTDYSIKKTSTHLTVTYIYLGIIDGVPTFEWEDSQY